MSSPQRYEIIAAPTYNSHLRLQFPSKSQLDTSMASPGVTGISNGVVKPDTEVDDGTEISTVSLAVVEPVTLASCVMFLRKS